jgi:hypothetical protein
MDLAAARSSDAAAVERERLRFMRALQPLLEADGPKLLVTDSQVRAFCTTVYLHVTMLCVALISNIFLGVCCVVARGGLRWLCRACLCCCHATCAEGTMRALQPLLEADGPKLLVTDSQVGWGLQDRF